MSGTTRHPRHPRLSRIIDCRGTPRFKANPIIRQMLEWGRAGIQFDLNTLAMWRGLADNAYDEDMTQLAQLIGYSTSGLGELPYVSQEDIGAADTEADKLLHPFRK